MIMVNIQTIKSLALYLWQLPQNLAGLLLRLFYKGYDSEYCNCIVRRSVKMRSGISLGKYIIINQWSRKDTIAHEYGHSKQSKYLGWLYLLIVGLPSLIHAALCKCKDHDYNDVWFEKWANKLGRVNK